MKNIINIQPALFITLLLTLIPPALTLLYMQTVVQDAPFRDQWQASADVAIATKEGNLGINDIIKTHATHIFIYNFLTTALFTQFTDWDIAAETYITWILACVNLILLTFSLRKLFPNHYYFMLPPLSAILFALNQEVNWSTGFMAYSQHTTLFLLLGMLSLQYFTVNWRALGLAMLFAFLGTFSSGNGTMLWVGLAVAIWFSGYTDRKYLLAWGVATIIAAGLYFAIGRMDTSQTVFNDENSGILSQTDYNPIGYLHFISVYISNPFTVHNLSIGFIIGLLGMFMLALNTWYVRGIWLAFAVYTMGNAALTTLGRLAEYTEVYLGLAMSFHYGSVSLLFWVAYAGSVAAIFRNQRPQWHLNLNLLFIALLSLLFIQTSVKAISRLQLPYGETLGYSSEIGELEYCVEQYPINPNLNCIDSIGRIHPQTPTLILQLAAHKLSLFRNAQPIAITSSEAPTIIHTEDIWLNVYARDWILSATPENNITHISQENPYYSTEALPTPPQNILSDPAMFTIEPSGSDTIWYLFTQAVVEDTLRINDVLNNEGYLGTVYPLTNTRYENSIYTMIRYQRAPENMESSIVIFGDLFTLYHWEFTTPPQPCETAILHSWWQIEVPNGGQHSLSLQLRGENNEIIVQNSQPIARLLTPLLQPEQYYFDERSIAIPCEGDFSLTLAMKTIGDDVTLLVNEQETYLLDTTN